MERCTDPRRKIQAAYELAGLEQVLTAAQQARARIHRKPERPALDVDLVLARRELRFGKLADGNIVVGQGTLEIYIALHHERGPEVRPVFGDEAHRMGLRGDSLVKRHRKLLPEGQGADVIQLTARQPSLAQIGFRVGQNYDPARKLVQLPLVSKA